MSMSKFVPTCPDLLNSICHSFCSLWVTNFSVKFLFFHCLYLCFLREYQTMKHPNHQNWFYCFLVLMQASFRMWRMLDVMSVYRYLVRKTDFALLRRRVPTSLLVWTIFAILKGQSNWFLILHCKKTSFQIIQSLEYALCLVLHAWFLWGLLRNPKS